MFESGNTQPQPPSSLIAGFDAIKKDRWQGSPDWLTSIREEGRDRFNRMGLPHRRLEDWKYTNVSGLSGHHFAAPAPHESAKAAAKDALEKHAEWTLETVSPLRLVLVNGFYAPELSKLDPLPEGVEVGSLAEALKNNHPQVKKHLSAYANSEKDSFVALNDAFIEDGAFLYIPKDVQLEHALHIIYITAYQPTEGAGAHHPRSLMVIEENASATIIEDYIGVIESGGFYLNNPVTEIVVEEGARVGHYKLQRESKSAFHIATIQVHQAKDSRFYANSIAFGGKLTRNNVNAEMDGSGTDCGLNGLFMIRGEQHVDNHTLIHHIHPHCHSSEVYHGILDDQSRGVFSGKIYVDSEAQKTDSQQTNRSLMLSDNARMDSKPQLEIFADDVKCTHGATVGRINEDSLYYLRSRGIQSKEARRILTVAFGQQVIDLFALEPLRDAVKSFILHRLDEWYNA
ncbi:MAG: Fe-S cluster assembly protein SufD [bacterium]|nr:Fe-S cluster assembly protein SufD [bacterium]